MRNPVAAILTTLVVLGPVSVSAQTSCGEPPLSQAQSDYLDSQSLDIAVPEGEVPVIQRCDTNADNVVDMTDIRAIARNRNQPSAHPDDPMDWDKNQIINILDARGCQRLCSSPRCALTEPEDVQEDGVFDEAQCFQANDFNGDGEEDVVAIYENTGEPLAGGYNLKLVIVNEDENGDIQQVTFPYSGRSVVEDGQVVVKHHVSAQPAGEVDLGSGSITIDQPGVVSYRDGVPKVIYYWKDGELNRAFYGIVD